MFGGWINTTWILLLTFFDATFANYSEDQCSWRGRQVLLYFTMWYLNICIQLKPKLVSQRCYRCLVLWSDCQDAAGWDLQGVIQMFASLCWDVAPGLPAGGIQGPDRQETWGLMHSWCSWFGFLCLSHHIVIVYALYFYLNLGPIVITDFLVGGTFSITPYVWFFFFLYNS